MKIVFTALLLVFVSASLTYGQQDDLLNILKPVNEKQRSRLAERLKLFIEYQRAQEWAKLLKLIDKDNARDKSIEEFADEMTRQGYLDFVPERTTVEEPRGLEYRIYGCVKARTDEGVTWFQGGLVAYLQDEDWYFTPHFLSYGLTAPLKCSTYPKLQFRVSILKPDVTVSKKRSFLFSQPLAGGPTLTSDS